jgi:SAM-dependent methyltransferase
MVWWFISVVILLIFLVSFTYAGLKGAPWVPTWGRDIERLGKLLELKPGQTFCELGCGDGRVTVAMSKQFEVKGIGVELSLAQYLAARIRKALAKSKKTTFLWKDAFKVDLKDVDALYLFLMPETYEKIRGKLEKELKPGTKVVTYVWAMPGWEVEKMDKQSGAPMLYLYTR